MANNFTQEQYKKAKEVNILDYLNKSGYQLKRKGKELCLKVHDSLVINPDKNTWYWHSQQVGGGILQFLQKYESRSLVESVNILAGEERYISFERLNRKAEDIKTNKKGEIILPNKNKNNKRVIAYLSKTRGIDFEVINHVIKNNLLYESEDRHECVFLSYDEDNNIKYATKRSTLTNNNFKQDVVNSNKEYGFKLKGSSEKLFVFESPIDLLSHATISKISGKDFRNDNRISLGGISDKSLAKFLEINNNIKEVIFFLDSDEVGIESSKNLAIKYGNDYKVSIFSPKYKDLNETLINYNFEKSGNENIKIQDYINKVELPFIPFKTIDNESIKNYINNIIFENEDISKKVDILFNEGIFQQSEDEKLLILSSDDKGNLVGGYEIDIYKMKYSQGKVLDKSEKGSLIFIKNEESDSCLITSNFANFLMYSSFLNVAYTNDLSSIKNIENILELENIKAVDLELENDTFIYNEYLNEESITYKNIEYLKNLYKDKFKTFFIENKSIEKCIIKDEFIEKPFVAPKLGDNERLFQFIKSNTGLECTKIAELFNKNLVYESIDKKAIFLIKDNMDNTVGGIEVDIYNNPNEYRIIENSEIDNLNETKNLISYLKEQIFFENEIQVQQEF